MATNDAPPSRSWIWPVAIAVVVLLGIVAVVAARSSNEPPPLSEQVSPKITVDGDPLPTFDDTAATDAAVGQTIPTITGEDFDGKSVTIGADGGAKLLMFVAHWCPHCQAEVPRVMDHLKEQPLPKDVQLEIISTGADPNKGNYPPSTWLEDEGWDGPVLADSKDEAAAIAFGLRYFPYFVAVDADGKVVARTSGEITMDQFDQLVAAAQGES